VLPGGEANLVVGRWRREVLVAPRVRHLAGKPGVARLRNGDHVKAVLAKQHHPFSSIARTTAMRHGETAIAAKNLQGTGNKRLARCGHERFATQIPSDRIQTMDAQVGWFSCWDLQHTPVGMSRTCFGNECVEPVLMSLSQSYCSICVFRIPESRGGRL
jgi:hypothetical protein